MKRLFVYMDQTYLGDFTIRLCDQMAQWHQEVARLWAIR